MTTTLTQNLWNNVKGGNFQSKGSYNERYNFLVLCSLSAQSSTDILSKCLSLSCEQVKVLLKPPITH